MKVSSFSLPRLHIFLLGITIVVGWSFFTATGLQAEGFAVFDIDKAAKELGIEADVKKKLGDLQKELEASLKTNQDELKAQLEGMKKLTGENPSLEQKQSLLVAVGKLEAELNQKKAEARQQLAELQQKLIGEFSEKIKPLALEAAKAQQFNGVVLKNTVFASVDAIDVTDIVIKKAEEKGMKLEIPEGEEEASEEAEAAEGKEAE